MKKVALVFLMGVLGCGAEPPNTDRPDAGNTPDVQMRPDVPTGDDRVAPPPDAVVTPDVPVMPDDAPPTGDVPPAMICSAQPPPSTITCAGVLCQPNSANPTCAGASACECRMTEDEMPAMLCRPSREAMLSCMSAVSCSPGVNHCSVNLPADVNYAPVPCLEPNSDGRGGLRRTLGTEWRRADLSSGGVILSATSLFSARGFVQVCSGLPEDLEGIPPEMAGQRFCTECAGTTCYWNRGTLRQRLPSVEIVLDSPGCSLEVRYFLADGASPARVRRYNSLNAEACN